jgi:hypothetical protein
MKKQIKLTDKVINAIASHCSQYNELGSNLKCSLTWALFELEEVLDLEHSVYNDEVRALLKEDDSMNFERLSHGNRIGILEKVIKLRLNN